MERAPRPARTADPRQRQERRTGAGKRRFQRERQEAERRIDRVRSFGGCREYPKYGMVSRYFSYEQALLAEAERLVRSHVLRDREDIYYLSFQAGRVILDMTQADLDSGDILVTTHTDPSWTPLFVAVAGLVTEVGGLMTHGVGDATRLIPDGQRIRVDGTDGYVEILP